MEKKKLSWEIIKNFLQTELKKSKHIMTFGTIGSLNLETDIDIIITKKSNSSSADFFREIHYLFDNLNLYIRRYFNTEVIRFAQATQEYLVGGYTKSKKIMFHTMIYISFPQIEKDWSWALSEGEDISEILKENYICIYGNVKDLFREDFKKENYFENLFIYLYLYDSFNSNVPKNIFLEIMNGCFKYIYKKQLKINNPIARNREEAKRYFYELCDILDKKNKEKLKTILRIFN